jgi:molecular chaperone HscB
VPADYCQLPAADYKMTLEPIPVRSVSTLECRSCGAGAPVDEHFCPQCDRILALGRYGDYFRFFGLPRKLDVDLQDLERRFRDLSRKFHPDYFYNAPPAERLASLERSSYLNDAYRVLRSPAARVEHLLAIEGLPPARSADASPGSGSPRAESIGVGTAKVPPSLLEEVFALNEELDEIRELRESGGDSIELRARLDAARKPIDDRRDEHERQLHDLSLQWDAREGAPAAEKRATLDALRERLLERNYINNLLATIEREVANLGSGLQAPGSGTEPRRTGSEARSPEPEARG